MRKNRFTEFQIMGVLREYAISSATFYKWRSKYGGMGTSMISQMKSVEDENRRLKKMFAEPSMQNELLKEALEKKFGHPSVGRWP